MTKYILVVMLVDAWSISMLYRGFHNWNSVDKVCQAFRRQRLCPERGWKDTVEALVFESEFAGWTDILQYNLQEAGDYGQLGMEPQQILATDRTQRIRKYCFFFDLEYLLWHWGHYRSGNNGESRVISLGHTFWALFGLFRWAGAASSGKWR